MYQTATENLVRSISPTSQRQGEGQVHMMYKMEVRLRERIPHAQSHTARGGVDPSSVLLASAFLMPRHFSLWWGELLLT